MRRKKTREEFQHELFLRKRSRKNIRNVKTDSFELLPGLRTNFLVTSLSFESSLDIESFPIERRGCRFSHENDLALFKVYSKQGCVFETALTETFLEVQCLPWDVVHHREGAPLCTRDYVTFFWGNFSERHFNAGER